MSTNLPTLTPDQQAAADAFALFLASDQKELVISGGAGVGKTTLLRYLQDGTFLANLQHLFNLKFPRLQWRFTATTNKAAEVLQSMGFVEACTIHSLLGIKVYNDTSTGTSRIERGRNSSIVRDSLIIIDECSMVDSKLRRLIDEGTFNCKIVYVGDHCQMAPITETLSPVFRDNTPAFINQVVRSQNAPPIMSLCHQLRETVETGVFKPIKSAPGFVEYLTPEQAQAEIEDYFVKDRRTDARILYFRNEMVLGMNTWIRKARGLPEEFVAGEVLVSNSATNAVSTATGNQYMVSIEQELLLEDVDPVEMFSFKPFGLDHAIESYIVHTGHGLFRVAKHPWQLKQVLQHFSKQKSWHSFFQIKESFLDLRMREACTVYKAQGSTHHTTFVDLGDIGRCNVPAQAARMLYVACSRPTHRLCFINRLPEKYGG